MYCSKGFTTKNIMSSSEIRQLREEIMQLRYSLEDQKSRSYLSILFYPITCLLYSLFNAIIDISFISILVYLMVYNNSWIYSFVLAIILIYRNEFKSVNKCMKRISFCNDY